MIMSSKQVQALYDEIELNDLQNDLLNEQKELNNYINTIDPEFNVTKFYTNAG